MKLKYVVIYIELPDNYCAYLPELPGCISAADTWEEIQEMVQEAVTLYLESTLETGNPIPGPRMSLEDAMAHHCKPFTAEEQEALNQISNDWTPTLSITIAPIEVEVPAPQPVAGN